MSRFQIRASQNKNIPDPSDLLDKELGYSFLSDTLYIKHPNGTIVPIGGKKVFDILQTINKTPNPVSDVGSLSDFQGSITGNVLTNDTDPDGDSLSVISFSYGSTSYNAGESVSTQYGLFNLSYNGFFSYTVGTMGNRLKSGQQITEQFGYTVSDPTGARRSSQIQIILIGTEQAPVAIANDGFNEFNQIITGNVLLTAKDPDNDPLSVSNFSIYGIQETYNSGQTATIPGVGQFTLQSNGSYTFVPVQDYSGSVPVITYTISDGELTASNIIRLFIAPPAVSMPSNPVTFPLAGVRTFNVGPGQFYSHPDEIPWTTLTAGDVVNIYYRPQPYLSRIGICGRGTPAQPITINGVTDENGNRPIINGNGAVTPQTLYPQTGKRFFTLQSGAAGAEASGTIMIRRAVNEPDPDFKPGDIVVKNLTVMGASVGNTFTALDGQIYGYGFSAGIYGRQADYVLIENCIITDNTLGVFTLVNGGGRMERCENWTFRSNRVYGNGQLSSNTEHGFYIQGLKFTCEFNYFGQNRAGSGGATIKSRCGQDIIRYNWIEASTRAIDFVEMEDQDPWTDPDPTRSINQPYYGIDWCYGNVIINDDRLANGSSYRPIHYGADNAGQQEGGGAALIPGPTHRKKLHFFNNTFYSYVNGNGARNFIFQISARDIVVELWNNIFYIEGSVPMHWTQHAGTMNFRGTNLIYRTGGTLTNAQYDANPANVIINMENIISNNPIFLSTLPTGYDFTVGESSPALNVAEGIPPALDQSIATKYPVIFQPRIRSNGSIPRITIGAGSDLGAFEFDPAAPPINAPSNIVKPQVSTGTGSIGTEIQVTTGTWIRMSSGSYSFQWMISSGGVFVPVDGATSNTFTPQISGDYICRVTATNLIGSVYEDSNLCIVASSAIVAPSIVNFAIDQAYYAGTSGSSITSTETANTNLLLFMIELSSTGQPTTQNEIVYSSGFDRTLIEYIGNVSIGNNRFLHAWKALNIPGGGDKSFTVYQNAAYACTAILEIPGSINVGTLLGSSALINQPYQSNILEVTNDALLLSVIGCYFTSNGSFSWNLGFSQLDSETGVFDQRSNMSIGYRVASSGSYRSQVTTPTGDPVGNSAGIILLPISFN